MSTLDELRARRDELRREEAAARILDDAQGCYKAMQERLQISVQIRDLEHPSTVPPSRLYPTYTLEGGPWNGERIRISDGAGFIIKVDYKQLSPPVQDHAPTRIKRPEHVYIRTLANRFVYDGLKR